MRDLINSCQISFFLHKTQENICTFLLGPPCCCVARQEITLYCIMGKQMSNQIRRYKNWPYHSNNQFPRILSNGKTSKILWQQSVWQLGGKWCSFQLQSIFSSVLSISSFKYLYSKEHMLFSYFKRYFNDSNIILLLTFGTRVRWSMMLLSLFNVDICHSIIYYVCAWGIESVRRALMYF